MSPRNLLIDPAWQGSDLGHPLPDSPHAVSVALPRWRDVIAYEEKDPACRDALKTIYPRFGMHPLIQQLNPQVDLAQARSVSYRLADLLPIEPEIKQTLLQIAWPKERLSELRRLVGKFRD